MRVLARGGEGEAGSISPSDADPVSLEAAPVAIRSAESSSHGEDRQHDPQLSRDWGYTRSFLTGLGLWPLPGGVL